MPDYFEIEVGLAGVKPRIWRRFLVPKGATSLDLHQAWPFRGQDTLSTPQPRRRPCAAPAPGPTPPEPTPLATRGQVAS